MNWVLMGGREVWKALHLGAENRFHTSWDLKFESMLMKCLVSCVERVLGKSLSYYESVLKASLRYPKNRHAKSWQLEG